jgi:hypothetical protein
MPDSVKLLLATVSHMLPEINRVRSFLRGVCNERSKRVKMQGSGGLQETTDRGAEMSKRSFATGHRWRL